MLRDTRECSHPSTQAHCLTHGRAWADRLARRIHGFLNRQPFIKATDAPVRVYSDDFRAQNRPNNLIKLWPWFRLVRLLENHKSISSGKPDHRLSRTTPWSASQNLISRPGPVTQGLARIFSRNKYNKTKLSALKSPAAMNQSSAKINFF